MSTWVAIWVVFLHLVSDFLLQSREMGKKKSKELKWWASHVLITFVVFYFGCFWLPGKFAMWNALLHGAVDAVTWNVYAWTVLKRNSEIDLNVLKTTFKFWEDHWFYVTIGVDQFLHIATLLALLGWVS